MVMPTCKNHALILGACLNRVVVEGSASFASSAAGTRKYVGLMNSMGSLFIQDGIRLKPILEAIKARGLMFLDSGQTRKSQVPKLSTQIGLPRAISNLIIDRKPSKAAINRQLTRLENIAHKQTVSIGILHPYPVSLEAVIAWIKTLDQKKIMLGPISSMADIQLIK